jgi:predicted aspartyl protease
MDYDASVFPPAPRLDIRLIAQPHEAVVGPVSAFVDTGADATIVPLRIIRQLRAGVVTFKTIRGYTGSKRTVRTYLVDIEIGAVVLPGIEVVGDDAADDILLGRDALNKLRLLLDGPGQRTKVLG